jgi:hypothetical protein
MHPAARPTKPSSEEFELVATRYIAVPATLWGIAMLAVIASAIVVRAPAPGLSQAPADPAVQLVIGA